MDAHLLTLDCPHIDAQQTISALEAGKVLFFPEYYFSQVPPQLLTAHILDGSRKNISYDPQRKKLSAFKKETPDTRVILEKMMQGYADFAYHLVQQIAPGYTAHLQWGRTSFRPAEIYGRVTSKRKDDTRLHVDSFAASPVNGRRILRVFCNINPEQCPRVWHLGQPFSQVMHHFASQISPYSRWKAYLLNWVKATKSLRSAYDHYMLHLHDKMKLDEEYQRTVPKVRVDFPAHSTWIVFTDQVSHAALSGQHLLEQTFYLPVDGMANPELSPLNQWQRIRNDIPPHYDPAFVR